MTWLWDLRTQKVDQRQLQRALKMQSTKQHNYMQGCGLNSLVYAMQPSLVPHFEASEISLMDRFHGEPDGLLAEEGHCLVFSMVRIKGGVPLMTSTQLWQPATGHLDTALQMSTPRH
eukprot:295646-Pleurochrysis_carterae.AAC.1